MAKMHPLMTRAALLFGVGLLVGGGARFAQERYAPTDALPGLKVDGIELREGELRDLHAFVAGRADALRGRQVRVRVDGEGGAELVGEVHTLGELGVTVDVDAVVRRVDTLEHEGDLLERARLTALAARGAVDVPLGPQVDVVVASPTLLRLKQQTDAAPVSARLDLDNRAVIPEHEGRYLDPWASVAAILRAAQEDLPAGEAGAAGNTPPTITLPDARFPARHSSELLAKLDVHAVLGEYDTYFSRNGDQHRRGQNIDVAASKIDGLVILPGEVISFNGVVGERSEENGFAKSWEIFKGEMVEGVGGGTCQVASTFHAAAFFGGLDVLERLPHSRPSAYIPMGLDATVVYPIVDLKIRNPFDFPVVMHAKVVGNRLHMELLGPKKVARVGFARELVDTFPYKRKVTEEPRLAYSKRVVLKQHGIRGYRVKRSRTLQFADGKSKRETNVDVYPATTEIYEVPPGFDVSLLPPLPGEPADEGDTSPAVAKPAPTAPASGTPAPAASTPTPPASPAAPAAIVLADGTTLGVEVAPGAHAPTQAQAAPSRTLSITR